MLKIGDFSKLSRISIRMLRHYDEVGLLTPESVDNNTGYRSYSEGQLPVAARIVALRDMGFGLNAIGEILKNYDAPEALAEFLSVKLEEIKAEALETNRRQLLLNTTITRLRKDVKAMNYNVVLKTMPERTVASVRKVIPAYDQEGLLWQMMMTEIGPLRIQPCENCYSLSIFHDEGYKESEVDVEIQMKVKGDYQNTENVVFKTVSAMEIASATYKGSYDQLTEVNHSVANWVRDNGYAFDGPMFCVYHVSPAQTHNQDEYVTEVCFPVKRQ